MTQNMTKETNQDEQPGPPPQVRMMDLASGHMTSAALYAASRFAVADALKEGPLTLTKLAHSTGVQDDALFRMLRFLEMQGVFARDEKGRWMNTAMSDVLQSDAEGSVRGFVLHNYGQLGPLFQQLPDALESGQPQTERAYGASWFDWLSKNPEEQRLFNDAMTTISRQTHQAAIESYDFGRFDHIVDVAGGQGSLMAGILNRHRDARGTLLELPEVLPDAKRMFERMDVADRAEVVEGDFFKQVPSGADAYVLANVIHDWPDEQAVAILKRVREACGSRSRLLLLEMVVEDGPEPSFGKLGDVVMLLVMGGRERTKAEFGEILQAAGFRLETVHPTRSPTSVVEAVPA